MANVNNDGKKDFKLKVGHLMQEYERNQQEELLHKQQLKQNIMMQIMNNRNKQSPQTNKDQIKSHTTPTYNSNPSEQSEQLQPIPQVTFNPKDNTITLGQPNNQITTSLAQNSYKYIDQPYRPEEITFSSQQQKRIKSLHEELDYKPKIQPKEQEELYNDEEQQFKKSISRIAKYANKYFPNHFQEKIEDHKTSKKYEQQLHQGIKYENLSKAKADCYLASSLSYNQSKFEKKEQPKQQAHPEESEEEEEPEVEYQVVEEDQRGVFLTMEESESMTASDVPKNVAFEIKMDKTVDPDHLEELRKQKIREMQKKRQERIQQYRRNEANKKVQIPRGRSSHALKHEKIQKEEVDVEIPPKSVAIQRKSNINKPNRIQNRSQRQPNYHNQPIPLDSHESQYQLKPNRPQKKYQNDSKTNNNTYLQQQQPHYPPVSPIRTPKTIISENRPKSSYKNSNIFAGESQYTRQKSANRIAEPKIEPKDRKYSFTRQSNKKLMVNAITYVCFPGELNRKDRQRLIQVLQSSQHEFFVFLFKQYSRKIIKGIYILDNSQTKLQKIYGQKGPTEITADRVKQFYRFDSGSRQFKKVDGCRSFSFIIHAIDLN